MVTSVEEMVYSAHASCANIRTLDNSQNSHKKSKLYYNPKTKNGKFPKVAGQPGYFKLSAPGLVRDSVSKEGCRKVGVS